VSVLVLIEDDPAIRTALERALSRRGHAVYAAPTAMAGLELVTSRSPDVVVLDLGLPDVDGTQVLGMIRGISAVPVIVATARDDENEMVRVLDLGADDYVVKPFGVRELVARIRAVTRRTTRREGSTRLVAGPVEIDTRARSVAVDGRRVELTPKEYDVLVALVGADGAVVSKQRLLQEVWGGSWLGAGKTVDVHVASLRRKLGDPDVVQTVRGVGLRIRA